MSGARVGRSDDPPRAGEIYIEYTIVGAQLRAVAIDAASGVEVSVFGPAKMHRDDLGQLAVRKLERRLEPARAPTPSAKGRYA
ncbi:MAG: hypothetical protein MI921_16725 [Cytophagales bacterium]|nr:hypothetical protein [Cytophagales bacterium]